MRRNRTQEESSMNAQQIYRELPAVEAGQTAEKISLYTDGNGDCAVIPAGFSVSEKEDEKTVNTGLVVIGLDRSEFVWIPTYVTPLAERDFGVYMYGERSLRGYHDETGLELYQQMKASVERYGGFYMGRYEASYGGGSSLSDYVPASRRVTADEPGKIWVHFGPQKAEAACRNIYADNDTVQGFFPWGANWDTTLQWLIDSGCKTLYEVVDNSSGWGNYSDSDFCRIASEKYTGRWEQAKANNIYDLAGNNWEWTQERRGGSYVMRGGGRTIMGGPAYGSSFPAAVRDPLPGSDAHPNVTFRIGLFVK